MMTLTRKQQELFDYIEGYITENTTAPSFDEMMKAMGFRSKSGVHKIIVALERRGYIRRHFGCARAIMLVDNAQPTSELLNSDLWHLIQRVFDDHRNKKRSGAKTIALLESQFSMLEDLR